MLENDNKVKEGEEFAGIYDRNKSHCLKRKYKQTLYFYDTFIII